MNRYATRISQAAQLAAYLTLALAIAGIAWGVCAVSRTGVMRERYSNEVEPRPSRFFDTDSYANWAMRADAWAVGK